MNQQQHGDEIVQFNALKLRLQEIWTEFQADPGYEHTSVFVPSLSVNQEELSKVLGASFYEERLLFALIRLRNPNARLIYLSSQPIHNQIVDYYLQMLDGVPIDHARQRLHMLSVYDSSSRPLTEKILERPRLMQRLRQCIGDPSRAYLTCYNSTRLERSLAVQLDIPLNSADPELLHFGSKSGSRKIFSEAGVAHPLGFEDLETEDDIVDALLKLAEERPAAERAVVKINEGFSGEGNGVFRFPPARGDRGAVQEALQHLEWSSSQETYRDFLRKFAEMGGIVEEMIVAAQTRSPSVQMRIYPDGASALVSSHEQVLGGSTGQVYLGCRFPSNDSYRSLLQSEAQKIGTCLGKKGVIGRFGIDFLVSRDGEGDWNAHAIEINLRMGGTTPPYYALEFLTGGQLDDTSGLFYAPNGQVKYYSATDNLKSPAYRGLLPADLFDIITAAGLNYRHSTGTGVLFYMIGALSQYGKLGMTCIGNSEAEAQQLFERTVAALDAEVAPGSHGEAAPLFDHLLDLE